VFYLRTPPRDIGAGNLPQSPPVYQDVLGYEKFDWVDETTSSTGNPDVLGTFNADTSEVSTAFDASALALSLGDYFP
jgi:hypothetical protein